MHRQRKDKAIVGICSECKVRDGDNSRKILAKCNHCGKLLCKKHIAPKLSVMRPRIDEIKNPIQRDKAYTEWRRVDGHPDTEWTEQYFKILEHESEYIPPKKRSGDNEKGKENIPDIKPPYIDIGFIYRRLTDAMNKPSSWYVLYIPIILALDYTSVHNKTFYMNIVTYLKYPFYILSTFLGGYIPYKLFRKYEYHEPKSDLQIWLLNIISGVLAFISLILLMFGMFIYSSSIIAKFGNEIGYGLTFFMVSLFLGLALFSGYLLFKYKTRSGIIIHRGEW